MAEKEYIEREAAYPLAKKICDTFYDGKHSAIEMPYLILDWIDGIPAADVRPVVRGKWISDHPGKNFGKEVRLDKDGCPVSTCHCSVCGEWLTASDEYPAKGRFCPNCGAMMEEN